MIMNDSVVIKGESVEPALNTDSCTGKDAWLTQIRNDLEKTFPAMDWEHELQGCLPIDSVLEHAYNLTQNPRTITADNHSEFEEVSSYGNERLVCCLTTHLIKKVLQDKISSKLSPHSSELTSSSLTSDDYGETVENKLFLENLKSCDSKASSQSNSYDIECVRQSIERKRAFLKRHRPIVTKRVPPAYAYCHRGVRCKVCYDLFKGTRCVDDLVSHVKSIHKKLASHQYLQNIRDENTAEKIIGQGMLYCECENCKVVCKGSIWNSTCEIPSSRSLNTSLKAPYK
ncbi:hypothetical protein ONE63_003407 [Megalurothrips usitatus]|uniref:C2H2-type domain-containing protein n=1 Tax=Megalurothrips usitatus TaxID=439358 RepID=A0AAV7XB78_9NEOP|nr:hypothetical protein ONE63_003407 [Megalurothrips usitatus]